MSHGRGSRRSCNNFSGSLPFLVLTEEEVIQQRWSRAKVHKIKMLRNLTKTILKKGHTYTNPRPSQYVTHAHSHITRAVAAMDSCFALIKAQQHGDTAVRMREVLARPWVGVCVPCFKFVLEILLLLYMYNFIF